VDGPRIRPRERYKDKGSNKNCSKFRKHLKALGVSIQDENLDHRKRRKRIKRRRLMHPRKRRKLRLKMLKNPRKKKNLSK
jgi:hypothetical protein